MKAKDRQDVRHWLESLPDVFIECRDVRHAWGGSQEVWRLGHGFTGRVLTCRRCGCTKDQVIDKVGKVVVTRMGYPTDYVKPTDLPKGRIPMRVVRELQTDTSTATGSAPDPLASAFDRLTSRPR